MVVVDVLTCGFIGVSRAVSLKTFLAHSFLTTGLLIELSSAADCKVSNQTVTPEDILDLFSPLLFYRNTKEVFKDILWEHDGSFAFVAQCIAKII